MANVRTGDLGTVRVIIIGGIGGLAAAVALQRRGFTVQVYERATELREIGAGVIIQPNGRRVLVDLGLDDQLAERSSCMTSMYTCHYATGEVLQQSENADVAPAIRPAPAGRTPSRSARCPADRGAGQRCRRRALRP